MGDLTMSANAVCSPQRAYRDGPDHVRQGRLSAQTRNRGFRFYVLLANPDIGVTQIAHRLCTSPATLDRYILATRTANLPDA